MRHASRFSFLLPGLLIPLARGDGVDPRPRTHPILVPAADIPTGVVRALAFSVDDRQQATLYSAGDDKLVRRWSLESTAAGNVTLVPQGHIVWPIYRDIRGVVYALDVARGQRGDRLAMGGIGIKPSQVNWLHADEQERPPQVLIDPAVQGRNAVYCVAHAPRDPGLLAVGHDGSQTVLVWKDDGSQPRVALRLQTKLPSVWRLAFNPSGTLLAIAGNSAEHGWVVEVWHISNGRSNTPQRTESDVTGLHWLDDETWRAATLRGVFDCHITRGHTPLRFVPADNDRKKGLFPEQVRGLAHLPSSDPAAAIYDSRDQTCRVCLLDLNKNKALPLESGDFIGPVPDVALAGAQAGDAAYLAAAGMATIPGAPAPVNVIRIWRIADGQARLIAQVPDQQSWRATGTSISQVSVLASGQRPAIGFRWGQFTREPQRDLTHRFDLIERRLSKENAAPAEAEVNRGTWRLKVHPERNLHYFLFSESLGTGFGPLPVWGQRVPRCFAVNSALDLLALGYSDGILVCDLAKIIEICKSPQFINDDQRKKAIDQTVLRSFYGHTGMVTSLAFAPDSQWLLSGSLDGTISAWTLQARANPKKPVGLHELGVEFDVRTVGGKAQAIVKNDPRPGSPAWEAGFRKGQVIERLAIGEVDVKPANWSDQLEKLVPGREFLVEALYQNRRMDLYSTVSVDPLWTLYPQLDGKNWILWTPPGHFEVSSLTDAASHLEFHINLSGDAMVKAGPDEKGALRMPSVSFQNRYLGAHYPVDAKGVVGSDVITRGEAAAMASKATVAVLDNVIRTLRPDPPRESYLPPKLELSVSQGVVTLKASPNGPEPIAELQIWLNGRLLKKNEQIARGTAAPQLSAGVDSALLRAGQNHLVGVAGIATPAERIYSRTIKPIASSRPPAQRKLHYLGIGVTELAAGQTLNKLKFAGHDVAELAEALRTVADADGKFALGTIRTLVAGNDTLNLPTEPNIRRELADLTRQVSADDLAIVFFSGHGLNTKKGFRFIAQDTPAAENAGISDTEIDSQLSRLHCRSLLMLDTCHAEGVEIQRQVLDWPGLQLGSQIVAACGTQEKSIELREVGFAGRLSGGHGLFTAALLEPLWGKSCVPPDADVRASQRISADANRDGQLTLEEWCNYARLRTPQLAERMPIEGPRDQHPSVVPSITFRDPAGIVLCKSKTE